MSVGKVRGGSPCLVAEPSARILSICHQATQQFKKQHLYSMRSSCCQSILRRCVSTPDGGVHLLCTKLRTTAPGACFSSHQASHLRCQRDPQGNSSSSTSWALLSAGAAAGLVATVQASQVRPVRAEKVTIVRRGLLQIKVWFQSKASCNNVANLGGDGIRSVATLTLILLVIIYQRSMASPLAYIIGC